MDLCAQSTQERIIPPVCLSFVYLCLDKGRYDRAAHEYLRLGKVPPPDIAHLCGMMAYDSRNFAFAAKMFTIVKDEALLKECLRELLLEGDIEAARRVNFVLECLESNSNFS